MQVIGHRGAAALAPENTWQSFERALALGVDAIETDIRTTSDGELVLLHDTHLERTTDGSGPICETPWVVVNELDAGSWFGADFRGARVPRLRDTLERYGRCTCWALEIKQTGIEIQLVELIRQLGLFDCVTFTSFFPPIVERVKQLSPGAKVGALTNNVRSETVERVRAAALDQLCPPAAFVSAERVSRWKALGLEVRAWGVKDAGLMRMALDAGVDGMTVDFPHLLIEARGRRERY